MAILVQYVVVRDGVEKMTFTSKKEADAYDKMLDIADELVNFFHSSELTLDPEHTEKLAYYCAQNKDSLISVLKASKFTSKDKLSKEKNSKTTTKK